MKKISLLLLSLLVSSNAFAAANDWRFMRRDAVNALNINFDIPTPASDSIMFLDITGTGAPKPVFASISSEFAYSGTSLSINSIAAGKITGLPTVAVSGAYADLTGKPTLFSGDYNDLANKPALFSGAYADLSGKPTLFSGDYNDLSNKPSIPAAFAVGTTPNSRTVALATAYQCTNTAKPCLLTVTITCPTLSVLGTTTCAGELRIGSANTVASGASGTVIAPISRTAGGVLGLASTDYETKTVALPVGWYFAVRQTTSSAGAAAMSVPAAFDQQIGN